MIINVEIPVVAIRMFIFLLQFIYTFGFIYIVMTVISAVLMLTVSLISGRPLVTQSRPPSSLIKVIKLLVREILDVNQSYMVIEFVIKVSAKDGFFALCEKMKPEVKGRKE